MIAFLGNFIIFLLRFKNYCIRKYQISKLGDYGKNVYIGADCILTMSNIFIGNDVYIGQRCIYRAKMYISIFIWKNIYRRSLYVWPRGKYSWRKP